MIYVWNSKHSTYYDKGRKAYGFGVELPEEIIKGMGEETFSEYLGSGLIANKAVAEVKKVVTIKAKDPDTKTEPKTAEEIERERLAAAEIERERLFQIVVDCGLRPHYKAGIPKLRAMIDDYEALLALKTEALGLGIDPSDDVTFEELSALVDEAKEAVDEVETGDEFDH